MSTPTTRLTREIKIKGNSVFPNSNYPGNALNFSRYTWISLIPKNLFEQFYRSSNLFFLGISILQLNSTDLSPTDSWATIVPFAALLGVSLIKDFIADFKIKKQDSRTNNAEYLCWDGSDFVGKMCQNINVGDFVIVHDGETLPADMILIYLKNSETSVYMDIRSLSGVDSLKHVSVIQRSYKLLTVAGEDVQINKKFSGTLNISEPSIDYDDFLGKFVILGQPGFVDLTIKNLVLRGSQLKNAGMAIGIVVYCGTDSKIHMNTQVNRRKLSKIENDINSWVLNISVILILFVVFSVLPYYLYKDQHSAAINPIRPIITFTLLYNTIVPISLFMTLDIIRGLQSYFLKRKHKSINILNDRVNEDLGQVEYILCDKTGIIKNSELLVSYLAIQTKEFNQSQYFDRFFKTNAEGKPLNIKLLSRSIEFRDSQSFHVLKKMLKKEKDLETAREFVRCLMLSNTARLHNGEQIGSREEIALNETAETLGCMLTEVDETRFEFIQNGELRRYERILSQPFDISRKSKVILLERTLNQGIIYVKGDFAKMINIIDCHSETKREITLKVNKMNRKGRRAVLFGYKKLSLAEVNKIKLKIAKIEKSLLNTSGKLEKILKSTEENLIYLGMACIEDQVSPQTLETIKSLKASGIKLWMLSGDSYNNSLFSASALSILKTSSPLVHLKQISDEHNCLSVLNEALTNNVFSSSKTIINSSSVMQEDLFISSHSQFKSNDSEEISTRLQERKTSSAHGMLLKLSDKMAELHEFSKDFEVDSVNYSVSIDGCSFRTALNSEACRKLLVMLLVGANSVCCSSFMPKDKGNLALMLKKNVKFKPTVLGITGNQGDIPLLIQSDIGISVQPELGTTLNSRADIIIPAFTSLSSLLLRHGHYFYFRISRTILLFFYKNFFLTLLLLGYTFKCSYSGTTLFNSSLLVGYNLVFTTLPVVFLGLFDKDFLRREIKNRPEIYACGIERKYFSVKQLVWYSALAAAQAAVFILLFLYKYPHIESADGKNSDFESVGTEIFVVLIVTVLLQIFLEAYCYSIAFGLSILLCGVSLFVFVALVSSVKLRNTDLIGVGSKIAYSGPMWLNIFFTSSACLVPTYFVYKYRQLYMDSPIDEVLRNFKEDKYLYRLLKYSKSLADVYRSSSVWNQINLISLFSMNKVSLKFKLSFIEKGYRDLYISDKGLIIKISVIIIWFLLIIWSILQQRVIDKGERYNIATIAISSFYSIIVYLVFTVHFKRHYIEYIVCGFFIGILVKFLMEMSFEYSSILSSSLIPALSYILLDVDWFLMNFVNLLNIILTVISINSRTDISKPNDYELAIYFIFLTSLTATSAIVGYFLELSKRKEYKLLKKADSNVEKTQNILSLLLPPFVKDRVKDGIRFIAESKGEVTVLFCDICDFESICKDYSSKELCEFLDSLFHIFDRLCEEAGVSKIETVGKTYMACSGLKETEDDLPDDIKKIPFSRRAIELALAMVANAKYVRLINGKRLHIKIGINTGPVVAGVVGYHKPQFSLVGDTVNTASRMCSTLEEYNAVQISESTFEEIKSFPGLKFIERTVQAKGKGTLNTYIVNKDKETAMEGAEPSIRNPRETTAVFKKLNRNDTAKSRLQVRLLRELSVKFDFWGLIKCRWSESLENQQARYKFIESNSKLMRYSLLIAVATYCSVLLLLGLDFRENSSKMPILIGKAAVVVCFIFLFLIYRPLQAKRVYPFLFFISLLLNLAIALLSFTDDFKLSPDYLGLEVMYIVLLLYHSSRSQLNIILLANLCIFFPWSFYSFNISTHPFPDKITGILITAGFSAINFFSVLVQAKVNHDNYWLETIASKEINQTKQLLEQMMPLSVLHNLQNNQDYNDCKDQATILFADIVGFTNWSSNKTPEEVVKMLSNMFTKFDKKCVRLGVYKVCTIGDCYVVLGCMQSLRDPVNECYRVLKMAKSMIKIIKRHNKKYSSELNMRIGIHTGSIIGGIIGSGVVRYDIWGEDVLIANKMESSGMAGKIHVSESTKDLLINHDDQRITFKYAGKVAVNSSGKMIKTYFVKQKNLN